MSWYAEADVWIQSTPVIRDNIIDLKALATINHVTREHMARRYSVVRKTETGWLCEIISVAYHTGYDSFNLKPLEPLNKYLNGEFVSLLSKNMPPEWNPADWDGTVRIFYEH